MLGYRVRATSEGDVQVTGAWFGEYFAGLQARTGQVLGRTGQRKVSQREEDLFAALIGDTDPMHNDPEWELGSGWANTIVLGAHALSQAERNVREIWAATGVHDSVSVETTALGRVRFVAPLPVGAGYEVEVVLRSAQSHDAALLLETTHELKLADTGKTTMVAEHTAVLHESGTKDFALANLPPIPLRDLEDGPPVAPSKRHDEAFYEGVSQRQGESLGWTPWTSISSREIDLFALLAPDKSASHGEPNLVPSQQPAPTTVRPLHLLTLLAYFMPQVGLPVLSDATMAAFNYGLNHVRWLGRVEADTPLRDHVRLLECRKKAPGRYLVTTEHVIQADSNDEAVLAATSLTLFVLR